MRFCQGRVLARQHSQAFEQYRDDVVLCQAIVRRMIVRRWYRSVLRHKRALEDKLMVLHDYRLEYKNDFQALLEHFKGGKLPRALAHLRSVQAYEHMQLYDSDEEGYAEYESIDGSSRPSSAAGGRRPPSAQRRTPTGALASGGGAASASGSRLDLLDAEDKMLREELGIKYAELAPMVAAVKKNLRRVARMCMLANYLTTAVQRGPVFPGSLRWDELPTADVFNLIENVQHDNEQLYMHPADQGLCLDFTFDQGASCFVSEVVLASASVLPSRMEILATKHVGARWTPIASAQVFASSKEQHIVIPGEQICAGIRIRIAPSAKKGTKSSRALVKLRLLRFKGIVMPGGNRPR